MKVKVWKMRLLSKFFALWLLLIALPANAASKDGKIAGHFLFEDRMPVVCITTPCNPVKRQQPIAGAKVVARGIGKRGSRFVATTSNDGSYQIALPAGDYLVSAGYVGKRVRVVKGKKANGDLLLIAY